MVRFVSKLRKRDIPEGIPHPSGLREPSVSGMDKARPAHRATCPTGLDNFEHQIHQELCIQDSYPPLLRLDVLMSHTFQYVREHAAELKEGLVGLLNLFEKLVVGTCVEHLLIHVRTNPDSSRTRVAALLQHDLERLQLRRIEVTA